MNGEIRFTRPDGRPLPEDHHLCKKNPRAKWVIRATLDRGPKFVGQRVTVPTHTHDKKLAQRIRDKVVFKWIEEGVLTRDIKIEEDFENVGQNFDFTIHETSGNFQPV